MLNGSRLYYKTITCKKNSAFCSVLRGNPAVASPKEKLSEQMTSNPAFTERNIQKPNAYLLACSAGVFFERAICLRKRHVETSQREEHLP